MPVNGIYLQDDSKIIIPDDCSEPLFIVPHQDIQCFVNNQQIFESTPVKKEDEIVLTANSEVKSAEVVPSISADRLYAYLQLKPELSEVPAVELKKSIDGLLIKVSVSTKKSYPFNLQQLKEILAQKGIVYGIDDQILAELISIQSESRTVVAKGEPPKPGVDESVNILIDTEADNRPQLLADGRVDYKKKQTVSVELGQVLAVKIPGKPGQPGIGVDGRPIAPPEYKKVKLVAGQGTMLQQGGMSIIATDRGCPSLSVNGNTYFFQVKPLIELKEVNLTTGNLEFIGDIHVAGDVAEGMSVFAGGNISIGGSVFSGKINSFGIVTIGKNAVSSFINAGGIPHYLEDLKEKLNYLDNSIQKLVKLLIDIKKRCDELNREFSLGQMIVALINKKFSDLPGVVAQMNDILRKKHFVVSSEIEDLLHELELKFKRLGWLKVDKIEEVSNLQLRIAAAVRSLQAADKEKKGDIVVSYAVNSTIEAAGNVLVRGKGCINTNINAKGDVVVDAVYRGGVINCQGRVKINVAGSELGAKTVIKTSGQSVQIGKAFPNVQVTAGTNKQTINTTEFNVLIKEEN